MVNWRMPFTVKKTKPSITYYGLTQLGRMAVENQSITGSRFEVASSIDFNQNCATIGDIVRDAQMQPNQVKQVLRALVREGMAERVTSAGGRMV